MIPITALLVALTPAQVRAQMVSSLIALGIRADLWRQGGTASTMLTVTATTFAGFSQTMVQALSALFLPTATGSWLVLLAYYVYGVTAVPASYGTGSVTLTNSGGGVYGPFQPNTFIIGNSVTGQQYTNTNVFTLNAATGAGPTSLSIAVTASTLGSAGSANPGDISVMVTGLLAVTVTNPAAVVGLDRQSDASIRDTCTNKLAALSVRNPRNAYKWAIQTAINPTTNAPVNINRIDVQAPGATYVNGVPVSPPAAGAPGTVTIYCAAPSGAASAGDLAAAGLNVETNVRAEGATASLYSATEVPYTTTLTVWAIAMPGLTAAQIQLAAETALTAFFTSYPISGLATDNPAVPRGLYGSALAGQIIAAAPTVFFVENAAAPGQPPPDQALAIGQVSTNDTTVNVRMVTST